MMRTVFVAALLQSVAAGITEGELVRPCGWFSWLFGHDCTRYTLHSFPTREVDSYITIGTSENMPAEMPETLHGLFYMDSNPLADEVVSFAGCQWHAEENACHIKVYGERVWGWTNTDAGENLYIGAALSNLVYKVQLNEEKNYARIIPNVVSNEFVARFFTQFDMYYSPDEFGGKWFRNSSYVGGTVPLPDYYFRQIVFGNGTRAGNWDQYYIANIGVEGRTLTESQFYAKEG